MTSTRFRPTSTQLVEMAQERFGLTVPFTMDQLKQEWRRAAKQHHPQNGGDAVVFNAVKEAYDALVNYGNSLGVFVDASGEVVSNILTTFDGIPLSELGLGLGPTVNGADCSHCEHKGYTVTTSFDCPTCYGVGIVSACSSCSGSGKFRQARSGRVVDCRVCKGTGKRQFESFGSFRSLFEERVSCKSCGGKGKIPLTRYYRCGYCAGTGEIRIWNPVIPKGRLAGMK